MARRTKKPHGKSIRLIRTARLIAQDKKIMNTRFSDTQDSLSPVRAWCRNCHKAVLPVKVDPKVQQWRCRCESCLDGAEGANNRTGWGDTYAEAVENFYEG